MPRILYINSVCGKGSTGKICTDLYDLAKENGFDCCIAYGRGIAPTNYKTIKIGNRVSTYLHVILSRLFDKQGFGSKNVTKKFLKKIDEYKPDIIHLHNIHGYYINIEILFNYFKNNPQLKIIWTLHDCWPFTGHCAYYLNNNCYKWQTQCSNCKFMNDYPVSYTDNSIKNFEKKNQLFSQLRKDIVIVPVSNWLSDQVKKSFLKNQKSITIQNGIDTNIFHYRSSSFRSKYSLDHKRIILGVSNVWDKRKGLDDFIKLSQRLNDQYKVVLIGLNKSQIKKLNKFSNVLGLERTSNSIELAEIYSSADIYCNFSKEETFGLTNYEAQACGTTTLSFDSGGTPETIKNKNAYLILNLDDAVEFITKYNYQKDKEEINIESFDKNFSFIKYIHLYKEILKNKL